MHKQLLATFRKFEASHRPCKKVFCTTCGGLAHALENNMTDELDNKIRSTLSETSLENFISLGEWSEFLYRYYNNEVCLIIEREGKNIDISNINSLDNYLLKARHFGEQSLVYKKLLKLGIEVAIESENESLLETLAIVLGKKILKQKKLLNLAIQKYKTDRNIHRVLYNNLRQEIPELRGFTGDGTSIPYY